MTHLGLTATGWMLLPALTGQECRSRLEALNQRVRYHEGLKCQSDKKEKQDKPNTQMY